MPASTVHRARPPDQSRADDRKLHAGSTIGSQTQRRAIEMSIPPPAAQATTVITGASSGIGSEIAREFAQRGHNVALVARSEAKLTALAHELTGYGVRADVLVTDLSECEVRATLLDRITALGLTPEILVNNAGFSTLGPIARSDPAAEMAMVEVDVMAVVDLCSRFVPGMVDRARGAVLNVASVAAYIPIAGQAGYCAGKAFVLTYTQCLAAELRGTGVTATALCPGPVDTHFNATAGLTAEDIDGALPKFMWETPKDVAKVGINGLDKGRMVAIPGLANRIAVFFATHAPKRTLSSVIGRRHPGMRR